MKKSYHESTASLYDFRYNFLMSILTPKIIIVGARLTFKTEIAFALNEHHRVVR